MNTNFWHKFNWSEEQVDDNGIPYREAVIREEYNFDYTIIARAYPKTIVFSMTIIGEADPYWVTKVTKQTMWERLDEVIRHAKEVAWLKYLIYQGKDNSSAIRDTNNARNHAGMLSLEEWERVYAKKSYDEQRIAKSAAQKTLIRELNEVLEKHHGHEFPPDLNEWDDDSWDYGVYTTGYFE